MVSRHQHANVPMVKASHSPLSIATTPAREVLALINAPAQMATHSKSRILLAMLLISTTFQTVVVGWNLPSAHVGMVQLFNHNPWLDPLVVAEDWAAYPPPAPVQVVTPSPPMTSSPELFLPSKTFLDKYSKYNLIEKLIYTDKIWGKTIQTNL